MKRILALVATMAVLAAIVISAPAGAAGGPQASAAAVTVKLKDSFFSPSSLTVRRGTPVRFLWAGKLAHNMTGGGLPKSLAHTRVRGSFTAAFSPGLKTIVCTIHPGMVLKLRVR